MNWGRNLRLSVQALGRARLRALLSSSSMAIGIAAITLLFAVGAGAERAFEQALEKMGKNLLSVGAQRKQRYDKERIQRMEVKQQFLNAREIPRCFDRIEAQARIGFSLKRRIHSNRKQ